jgi:hypothetical protein
MISFTDDGFSDADIKRIIANSSPDVPTMLNRPIHGSINATASTSSNSSFATARAPSSQFDNWSWLDTPSSHLPSSSTKGKGVSRGFSSHMTGHDESEWEREGESKWHYSYQFVISKSPLSRLGYRACVSATSIASSLSPGRDPAPHFAPSPIRPRWGKSYELVHICFFTRLV